MYILDNVNKKVYSFYFVGLYDFYFVNIVQNPWDFLVILFKSGNIQ